MVGNAAGTRRRTAWNTAPGVLPADEALIADWHEAHPVAPWRGQDGRGGFVGWANRLDERVARSGHLMSPRSEVIPIKPGELLRESVRVLKDWRVLLAVIIGLALAVAISPALGVPIVGVVVFSRGAGRIRSRKREAMRAELATLGSGSSPSDALEP